MLKPKNSQSGGCVHTFTKQAERKLMAAVFLTVQERMLMVGFMQQRTTITLEVYCEMLKKKTAWGRPFKTKGV
jgi:hypothetical protein